MPAWKAQLDCSGCGNDGQLGLNQGYLSYASGGEQWLAGRERFSWGPATFRSPSNPFYFDSGKTNPLADTPGIDLARWTHSQGAWRLTSAYVSDTRTLAPPRQLQTMLFKRDRQGDSTLFSLIVSQPRSQGLGPFWGGFAQYTPDDAWLLYAEASSQRGQTPPSTQGVAAPQAGSRWLAGASYTRESGQVLSAEYLFNGSGRPTGWVPLPSDGQASLRNRHYLWASLQSNPQELNRYWRLEWTFNLDDRSRNAMAYGETRLSDRLSGFAMLNLTGGGAGSEYGGAFRGSLTLGLKLYLL
ncbi:hypothetical protein BI347_10455 [Chromobacterium sphagni]|uniref:Uncharacterized protein n=1 Tax=Chromobacterium sphagni TaxID=1903179 RepID=A0A1S1X301_9NEIS|nr:hypothetical protein [Chromobacterium sphagni]OHX13883.1 hypothetical protein BI347_10455 [Chromobacterium sphagni]